MNVLREMRKIVVEQWRSGEKTPEVAAKFRELNRMISEMERSERVSKQARSCR